MKDFFLKVDEVILVIDRWKVYLLGYGIKNRLDLVLFNIY